MQEAVDDRMVQFGLVRFEMGSDHLRRQKIIFVHVNGVNCPAVARGRANEYMADAKAILDAGAEPLHASVEIKEKADVTTENIISRVSKFFIADDAAQYTVKWLMESYEQFILESYYKKETSACNKENTDRKVRFPGHNSAPLFTSGRDALKSVAGPSGPWNWVFVLGHPENLPLVSGGAGSVDEMRDCMKQHDEEVMFGLLRMAFGVGRLRRIKHIFVQAIGEGVSAFQRGKLGANRPKMEKALNRFAMTSVAVEITDPADFTVQDLIERVRQAAIIDDNLLDPDDASKNIFSVEHFRMALREEMGAQGLEVEREPWKSKGGFGDQTADEIARLVRLPDGDFNWALFSLNMSANKAQRPAAQNFRQFRPTGPTAPCAPHGGYAAASVRAKSSMLPASPAPCAVVMNVEPTPSDPGVKLEHRSRVLSEVLASSGPCESVTGSGVGGSLDSPAVGEPDVLLLCKVVVVCAATGKEELARFYWDMRFEPDRYVSILNSNFQGSIGREIERIPNGAELVHQLLSSFHAEQIQQASTHSGQEQRPQPLRARVHTVASPSSSHPASPQPLRARVHTMASPSSSHPVGDTLSFGLRPRALTGASAVKVVNSGSAGPCWGIPLANAQHPVRRLSPKPGIAQPAHLSRLRLAGALLKQTPGFLQRWQLRHFEIGSGKLRWWNTVKEKNDGGAPKNDLDLQGLSIQQASATSFKLQTSSSTKAGKVYTFDAGVQAWVKDDLSHSLARWVQALQQEATTSAVLGQ